MGSVVEAINSMEILCCPPNIKVQICGARKIVVLRACAALIEDLALVPGLSHMEQLTTSCNSREFNARFWPPRRTSVMYTQAYTDIHNKSKINF